MSKVCIESIRGLHNYYNICSELQQHLDAFSTKIYLDMTAKARKAFFDQKIQNMTTTR